MKSFNAILTIGSILAFAGCTLSAPLPAVSGPENQRVETVVEYVTEVNVVGVTVTVWVPPGQTAPPTTTEADSTPSSSSSSKKTTTTTTTPEETSTTSSSSTEETTSTTSSTSTEETTSTTTSTTQTPEEPSTTSTPPPPPPTTTKAQETTTEVVIPTPTPDPTTPIPEPMPTNGLTLPPFDGTATWYDTGMGSCGNTRSHHIVALSHEIMEPLNPSDPNKNPLCGKTITCYFGQNSVELEVVDTCMGCPRTQVDVSPDAFDTLGADRNDGKIQVHCVPNW